MSLTLQDGTWPATIIGIAIEKLGPKKADGSVRPPEEQSEYLSLKFLISVPGYGSTVRTVKEYKKEKWPQMLTLVGPSLIAIDGRPFDLVLKTYNKNGRDFQNAYLNLPRQAAESTAPIPAPGNAPAPAAQHQAPPAPVAPPSCAPAQAAPPPVAPQAAPAGYAPPPPATCGTAVAPPAYGSVPVNEHGWDDDDGVPF